ncbi:hypothetical protein UVI_02029940 [Ustilaginoidea virens]|uniref:Glycosyl transferase family 17 protein n=1 Tax=Ustilaginoidea virens TaxID=1159556 RepID=A0A1B5L882_USTVR|nr:hypothetical protein UVI_02029940 [Ustilaginoidea virens]
MMLRGRPALLAFAAVTAVYLLWYLGHLPLRVAYSTAGLDRLFPSALETQDTVELCKKFEWSVYPESPKRGRRRIYDLFLINTETDWLEVRLGTMYDQVDYFVVVESNRTFTGKDKPLIVKDRWAEWAKFHKKMVYHQVQVPASFQPQSAWETEGFMRNALLDQAVEQLPAAKKPRLGDVLIVSDADEVPRPSTLEILRACDIPVRVTLWSQFFYYSFQFRHRGTDWHAPHATFYNGIDTVRPDDLRSGKALDDVPQGGIGNSSWHCSSCFRTVKEFQTKLLSFSHTEYSGEKYRDPAWIADHVRAGKDMYERDSEIFDRVDDNADIPDHIARHKDKFSYMVSRDGDSSGFADYP